jgi:hypothetical protein
MKSFLAAFLFFIVFHLDSLAQTVPIGMPVLDESLRILQLEGKLDSRYSLSSRPFFTDKYLTTDSILHLINPDTKIQTTRNTFWKTKGIFELLPVSIDNQYNSHHPYGWNTGGMIDAKGYQAKLSTGFYVAAGILSIQVKPELVYAQNPEFEYSAQYGAPTSGTYKKIFAGQSSLRLSTHGISLGVSTENMWWGPGSQNALIMSNNAPGFLHLTLNSTKPLKTAIGNFEFQLIGGKLTEDTTVLLQNKDLTTPYYAQNNYSGQPSIASEDHLSWKYINAITISYNPKWIKHLYLGFNRVGYVYHDSLEKYNGFIHNYLPVFAGLFRSSSTYAHGSQGLKQMVSVSARYLMPLSHAELYIEYGTDDNTFNLRDLLMSPNHAIAYTAGFKKLFQIRNNKWVHVESEFTQLAQSVDNSIRTSGYWYLYAGGYTNQGRIIGNGMGMGSNMQTLSVTFINGLEKAGFIFQRLVHDPNPDLGVIAPTGAFLRSLHWDDYSVGFTYRKQLHNVTVNALLQGIHSTNYAWIENKNVINFHGFISLLYYL